MKQFAQKAEISSRECAQKHGATYLAVHFLNGQFFCFKMKRTSCSEVLVDSQLSVIIKSSNFCFFKETKTAFTQFLDKKLLFRREF